MIVKEQPRRQNSNSSFKRLQEYLTSERDLDTGTIRQRGDILLSSNLASLDTVAAEMNGVAALNARCQDALYHYEIAWPPGEMPTREQWCDSALHTLRALDYQQHQYIVVAHDDKAHFHIHIMVNKVHPETLKALTPHQSHTKLHAAARYLEAKYGWKHTPGLVRWDAQTQRSVPVPKAERHSQEHHSNLPTGGAAKLEHYHDEESLQSYVRREVAPRIRTVLTRHNASWDDLHTLLAKFHLRIEKAEAGGYTVLAIDHNIRVKASDVIRHHFAGKQNRQATEQLLGPWTEPSTTLQHTPPQTGRNTARNQTLREERKEQRRQDRSALISEYNQYRNLQRGICKGITAQGRNDRQHLLNRLKQRKKEIRALRQPWPAKEILLSQAVAASVIELQTLKLSTHKARQAQFPKDLRTWVAERAAEGDARAAAQLRGWRYADQRTQRRLNSTPEANALHLSPAPTAEENPDWSDFVQQQLAAQKRLENLTEQLATTRIWTINRATGDVSYTLNGKLSVIDRGRRVTVLNQNEAAIVFGLEMAVQKYGSHIACSGGDDWKRQVVRASVQNGIFVEFTDPAMQDALRQQQLMANPLQIKAARLYYLETRLQNEETNELLLTNEADVHLLLSCLQPAAHSEQLLEVLKASQDPEPKANVGGDLTIAILKTPEGHPSFRVSISEEKRKHVLDRVAQVRQAAHRALRDKFKTPSHEREDR
jgi:Relaxase/Mobilisation nuclease domain/Large polyvalent protein-associated domain 7